MPSPATYGPDAVNPDAASTDPASTDPASTGPAGTESGSTDPGGTGPAWSVDGGSRLDTEVAARLRLVLGRVGRRIRLDTEFGLPPLQNAALATIDRHGPLRLGELAAREGVTAPTMSRVLGALEERGLVDRRPDPGDARSVLLSLTDSGAATLAQIRSAHTAVMLHLLERLDSEQLETLIVALPVLEALVESDPEPPSGGGTTDGG